LPQELFDDLAAQRTQGKAQADFTLADVYVVAERPVQTDASQGKSRRGKERQQDGAEAVFGNAVREVLL
jgi:hypothetical protein